MLPISNLLIKSVEGYQVLSLWIKHMCMYSIHICWTNEHMNENPNGLLQILINEKLYAGVKIMCQTDKVTALKISEEWTQAARQAFISCVFQVQGSLTQIHHQYYSKCIRYTDSFSLQNLKNVFCMSNLKEQMDS